MSFNNSCSKHSWEGCQITPLWPVSQHASGKLSLFTILDCVNNWREFDRRQTTPIFDGAERNLLCDFTQFLIKHIDPNRTQHLREITVPMSQLLVAYAEKLWQTVQTNHTTH